MGFRTVIPVVALGLVIGMAASAAGTGRSARSAKPAARPAKAAGGPSFSGHVVPVLQKYCIGCHGPKQQIAGIDVTKLKDEAGVVKARDIWERIAENLASGHMPPKKSPQPAPAQRAAVTG